MEWTFAVLLGIAVLLLIVSLIKTKKLTSKVEQEIDQMNLTYTDELYKLKQRIKQVEIDGEIIAHESGVISIQSAERKKLREALELYKRGYSIESIASKTQTTLEEMQKLLSPYAPEQSKGGSSKDDSTSTT